VLDIGWPELLMIMAVAVVAIGPDEIPVLMRGLGRIVRRFQYIKFALSRQFDEIMQDSDLEELRNSVNFEAKRYEEAIQNGDFNEAEADEYYDLIDDAEAPKEPQGKDQGDA